ncbi:Uncharacterised protein [Listeria fleischmannii subsp. fleischmannii]|uniref:Uncharacterized protein n=1 Tax=Listeria fleischmannii subsp. fleischmannii TaxID=1671902 RepID=A0A2X3H9X0_9LIST|nr:hypothetical protein [Listeria fleischmannii]SQC69553.1 Uncharacterised protein [Listeria fleischmannii subsp. fleischmannii]
MRREHEKKNIWIVGIILIVVIGIIVVAALNTDSASDLNQDKDVTTKVKESTVEVKASGTGTIVPQNMQYPNYDELELNLQIDEIDIPQVKKDKKYQLMSLHFQIKRIKEKWNLFLKKEMLKITWPFSL